MCTLSLVFKTLTIMARPDTSTLWRILLILCGLALISVLWLPFWQILLGAPQYPEGLTLKIHAGKLSGDVDIINGLNHYIGMKTIHESDFAEFKVLPYCIIFFALFFIIVGWIGKRAYTYLLLVLYLLFGVLAMYDFWKWEYDYGHHLAPDAAIKVPDMTYQPPLIGHKQLLNFEAVSLPDVGGWLFIACGLVLVLCLFFGRKKRVA
jgi:copper chaperone NosL